MSLMKRFGEDRQCLTERAARAAWERTSNVRESTMAELIQDCRASAQVYADPVTVTRLFVSAVVKEFMTQRTATTHREAS
jgi:hypothetical protein